MRIFSFFADLLVDGKSFTVTKKGTFCVIIMLNYLTLVIPDHIGCNTNKKFAVCPNDEALFWGDCKVDLAYVTPFVYSGLTWNHDSNIGSIKMSLSQIPGE